MKTYSRRWPGKWEGRSGPDVGATRDILLVSKPIVPPWNDSGKNIVRDLAASGIRYTYRVMGDRGALPPGPSAMVERVYSTSGAFAPGLRQNLSVLRRLLTPDRVPLYHFFFAPNPRTSAVARMVLKLKRRKVVHTICSTPATPETVSELMFADQIVALSKHTAKLLKMHGVDNVVHIPPCVPLTPAVSAERKERVRNELGLPQARYVVFPGDYEFSNAARVCVEALPIICTVPDVHFVFACRIKRPPSLEAERIIKDRVKELGLEQRVTFVNQVADMEALVAAATLTVLPADSLYAKMDIPLVLLESLREGVPIVVSDHGPLPELVESAVGVSVPSNKVEPFGQAVLKLMNSLQTLADMGAAGQDLVRTTYSPDTMARRYEALYDELIGAKS